MSVDSETQGLENIEDWQVQEWWLGPQSRIFLNTYLKTESQESHSFLACKFYQVPCFIYPCSEELASFLMIGKASKLTVFEVLV